MEKGNDWPAHVKNNGGGEVVDVFVGWYVFCMIVLRVVHTV